MSKKRVSLTLDQNIVERVDKEAERRGLNRSQMMEKVAEDYFRSKGVGTAVIFCGDPELKTLELYEGKPVISHIMDHLVEEGISRVILLVGQNKEIEDNFGSEYNGLALEYIMDEQGGTARALQEVEDKIDEAFVALNGHVIADVDIQDMLRVHEDEGKVATMSLTAVENPSTYGVARLKGRQILGFVEKPESGEEPSRLINAGTYIFDPEIFNYLEGSSIETVFEKLASNGDLAGYIYGGEWREIEN